MKKISFFAVACAIAMTASVSMTSCGNKKAEPTIPEGTAIGSIKYFMDEGTNTISFIRDKEGTPEVQSTQYTEIKEDAGFLVAQEADGKLNLLSQDGHSFAIAESYEVGTLAPISPDDQPAAAVFTVVPGNGNHLCYLIESHTNLAMVAGIKSAVIPLNNGFTIYQKKTGWGFGKSDAEDGVLEDLKAINAVSTKSKFFFWVQSGDFTGLVDESGNGVKPMSQAAFKALQKKSKVLWERDGSCGIYVKSI